VSLKTKESRRKIRRWSFQAVLTTGPNETKPLRLEQVSFGTHKQALQLSKEIEQQLRTEVPMFKAADLKVLPIEHETISLVTLQQVKGYKDMSMILDLALELAIQGSTEGYNPFDESAENREKLYSAKEEWFNKAREKLLPKKEIEPETQAEETTVCQTS
jgi:hypothetical protein